MTLLIATRSRSHILLSADGRCSRTDRGVRTPLSDTQQKIFPIDELPMAFAHHGENVLGGKPISEVLDEFRRVHREEIHGAGPRQISGILAQSLDFVVTETLKNIADSTVCGFWVCGFESTTITPQIYEVIWHKESAIEVNLQLQPHGDLLVGGDGSVPIKIFLSNPVDEHLTWEQVYASDRSYCQALHAELYRRAEFAQATEKADLFGGHQHQLLVTTKGCEWLRVPEKG